MELTSPELVKVISVTGEQGSQVHRWFCTECGSYVFSPMPPSQR